jgi:hypothetical protein
MENVIVIANFLYLVVAKYRSSRFRVLINNYVAMPLFGTIINILMVQQQRGLCR